MPKKVTLFEVGPRDGLQNEKVFVPTSKKVALIDHLSDAGFKKIEAASFVSPKWVPQMADGAEVMAGISRNTKVTYAALTPNMQGYERALEAKIDEIAIFGSASEGVSQKNINASIAESLERFKPVAKAATKDKIPMRGYVSCVVRCPYDGNISPSAVADIANELLDMGCYEISLGDTIGAGKPETISKMLEVVIKKIPPEKLAGHYHDTGDKAILNIEASLEFGLLTFDSAIGGLGGCPYAPGAKGNVSTLKVHDRLTELGYETGLDRDKLVTASDYLTTTMADLA